MTHTPLPWHVEPVTDEDDQQFYSEDFSGKVFCVCHPQTVCNETTVIPWISGDDAEFIVRACNSHYELLEALDAISNAHLPDQPDTSSLDEREWAAQHIRKLRRIARDAAAKARGEQDA